MGTLIHFENVGKEFTLRKPHARGLRSTVVEILTGGMRRRPAQDSDIFVALRDVSFTVGAGESLGIIGENGSGKSTILKLVTRIFEPSAGTVHVDGRVAALLELGAGFHPELTGRENIYLSGSILGMTAKEISHKLDEIVAFTEIEPFIDVQVKHYSSGMYMRLGFAVAVHVEPQILLIDEVLAVGDYNFQRKCLEHINAMRHSGVTIVFVSHDLDSVRKLCTRVLWLEHANVREDGPTDRVVDHYVSYMIAQQDPMVTPAGEQRFGSYEVEITGVELLDKQSEPRLEFRTGDTLVIRIHYRAHQRVVHPVFGIALYLSDGTHVSGPNSDFSGYVVPAIEGQGHIDVTIDDLPLLDGNYLLSTAIYDEARIHPFDSHERRYTFRVVPGGVRDQYGLVHLPVRWSAPAEARSQRSPVVEGHRNGYE